MAIVGYNDTADLTAYAAARGIALTEDEAVLLTRSLDWLELQPFSGAKTDPLQALEWPRTGITGVADDVVPDKIKTAQIVCALIYNSGGDPLAAIEPFITQESVAGAVSVSYSDKGPVSPIYTQLNLLLRDYVGGNNSGSGSNQFAVGRA